MTELADVSASEADVFMALRVRVPPLAFLMTVFCKGALSFDFMPLLFFVVLSEDSGIFRDTRVFRQGDVEETVTVLSKYLGNWRT